MNVTDTLTPARASRDEYRRSWLPGLAVGEVISVSRSSITFRAHGCTLGQMVRVLPSWSVDKAAASSPAPSAVGMARVVEADAGGLCAAELLRPVTGLGPGCLVQLHPPTDDHPEPDALFCRVTDGWLQATSDSDEGSHRPGWPIRLAHPDVIHTGRAVIDVLHPWRAGTRMVLAGPAGAGKTSLINHLMQAHGFDHLVVAAIGERGHEIARLAETARRQNTPWTLIGCSAATTVHERCAALANAVHLAQASARRGRHVLLMVDSLTRWARAASQAMSGLTSTQETATHLAVIEHLAACFEACLDSGAGRITAIFSTLTPPSGPDHFTEECLALSDGHWVLTRELAQRLLHPAVDPLLSLCRSVDDEDDHHPLRRHVMNALHLWQTHGDSIELGLVQPEPDSMLGLLSRHHASLLDWLYRPQDPRAMSDIGLNIVRSIQPSSAL